jgi:hypothetical protein
MAEKIGTGPREAILSRWGLLIARRRYLAGHILPENVVLSERVKGFSF